MTAVYAWYPGRYDYKDAFRMGNYSLLGYVGANISLEFLYSGPHSLLTRMHLNDHTERPMRQIRVQTHDRPEIQRGCRRGPSTSGAADITDVPHGESALRPDQQSFSSGSAIWAYSSGGLCGPR